DQCRWRLVHARGGKTDAAGRQPKRFFLGQPVSTRQLARVLLKLVEIATDMDSTFVVGQGQTPASFSIRTQQQVWMQAFAQQVLQPADDIARYTINGGLACRHAPTRCVVARRELRKR